MDLMAHTLMKKRHINEKWEEPQSLSIDLANIKFARSKIKDNIVYKISCVVVVSCFVSYQLVEACKGPINRVNNSTPLLAPVYITWLSYLNVVIQ